MERIGWLRAAVLGANDGIVSSASLIVGVAGASAGRAEVLLAGIAGLVAGAMSMAAGEYVSVSSQSDAEAADLALEQRELARNPEGELAELTDIWIARGLPPALAGEVARTLSAHDALAAHARDEIGLAPHMEARPVEAAFTSAGTFAVGAALPLLAAVAAPAELLQPAVVAVSLAALALLGAVGARAGGAPLPRAILRVTFWGAAAMAATAFAGRLFGALV